MRSLRALFLFTHDHFSHPSRAPFTHTCDSCFVLPQLRKNALRKRLMMGAAHPLARMHTQNNEWTINNSPRKVNSNQPPHHHPHKNWTAHRDYGLGPAVCDHQVFFARRGSLTPSWLTRTGSALHSSFPPPSPHTQPTTHPHPGRQQQLSSCPLRGKQTFKWMGWWLCYMVGGGGDGFGSCDGGATTCECTD